MLSISKMSAESAMNYYQKSGDEIYYQQNPEEIGIWQGELATALCLEAGSEIDPEQFKRLLHQIHPTQDVALVERSQEVAGLDFTFSAPKSVSILIEIHPDSEIREELRNAHNNAVERVRKLVESEYSGYQTREPDGSRGLRGTGKMLSSSFNHSTNRNHEPDTHTHLFVFNNVQDETGKWRSLDARELFKNEYYFGMTYRSELASELENLNYDLRVTDREQGFFELSAISEVQIRASSSRAQEIEVERERMILEKGSELTKNEHESAKTSTRGAKKKVDRDEIRAQNIEFASTFETTPLKKSEPLTPQITAFEALEIATNALSEKEAIFKKEELYRAALKVGLGSGITLSTIETAALKNDNLIFLENNRMTTHEISEIESSILRDIEAGRGQYEAVLETEAALKSIDVASQKRELETGFSLTSGQRATGSAILSNKSSILLVSGDAGSGKTTLLADVNRLAQENGRTIFGAAYTGSAAAEIEAASGIKSQTLHSLLLKKSEIPENSMIVVDEASMLGSRQFRELQEYAAVSHSQIVLIGDQKQMKGMGGGDLFSRLQNMPDKCQTAVMTESLRAQTSELKELYQLVKDRKFVASFEKMESRNEIVEASKVDAIKEIVQKYDEKTLVIADLNSDRMSLNYAIREHLGFRGGEKIPITQNLTIDGVSRHFSQSYEVGHKISAEKAFTGMKAGSGGIIKEVDSVKNSLIIEMANGKDKVIDLYKFGSKLAVTRQAQREFNVGEKIVFGKNNTKELNVRNGQGGTIESISKNILRIKHEDGKVREVDISKYNHLDYGYARTVMASQGQSHSKVLGLLDPKTASSNSYYVAITRARHSVKIWTNDFQKFKLNVEKMQSKTSTIGHLSSWSESQKIHKKGIKNGKRIIESLRSSIGNGRAKLDSLKADIGTLIAEIRERWETKLERFTHEYRQSIKNDREQAKYHASEHSADRKSSLRARIHVSKQRGGAEQELEIGR